jgi:endonuclease YncB( thermonuclease family)
MSFLPNICQAEITRVVDGDTYVAAYNQREYMIRVIGADTFETRYGKKLLAQSEANNLPLNIALQKGRAAKNFAQNILLGETVTLTRPEDAPDNDGYFRHLRVVQVLWGNVLMDVATLLVQRGHCA